MLSLIKALRNIIVAVILVGEPILFALKPPVSVPLLLLIHTWQIQALVAFCLALLEMPRTQALKMIILAVVSVAETSLFSVSDRMVLPLILLLILTFPFQTFIAIYLIMLAPKMSGWSWPRRILTVCIALPVCFGVSIILAKLFWGAEHIRNATQLGENSYYLTTKAGVAGPGCDFECNNTIITLYKCNSIGLECVPVFGDEVFHVSKSSLVVDKAANELQIFLEYGSQGGPPHGYGLSYVYGAQPRFVELSKEFDGKTFYVTRPAGQNPPIYMLYQCNQDSLSCQRLPFEYNLGDSADLWLDIDADKSKLTISDYSEFLIYTYDIIHSQSFCYAAECKLKSQ